MTISFSLDITNDISFILSLQLIHEQMYTCTMCLLNHFLYFSLGSLLKHKDSFGKSENLSKIFFAEIIVFDHDYEGKSSSSNGLLWISFIFLK